MARRDAAAFLDDDFLANPDLECCSLAAQALRDDFELDFLLRQVEYVLLEEHVEDLLLAEAERTQDDGHRQFAATVDAGEYAVLRVELKVQPRAAIGDDAGGKQQLAG